MEQSIEEYFHEFRQDLLTGAEADKNFQLTEFMNSVAHLIEDTGGTEGFEFCSYKAQKGMRVDGYWFNDEDVLDLFVADFDFRDELVSLTETEVRATFNRLINFFTASKEKELFRNLEETAPEYGLSRQIHDLRNMIRRINFFVVSERKLSERLKELEDNEVTGIPASYHIWDFSRLYRLNSSKGYKESLDLNLIEMFGKGIPCLQAHQRSDELQSYLIVIPASILADLYEKYGARLLEQNVRCFLQARGKVNKGIRSTIIAEPNMFFAYNNGITATAQSVEIQTDDNGLIITGLKDLQIVNGGQTTASLFHTRKKDKASLDNISVQMKLSVISDEQSEEMVPKISEYANTQNKVNAADFFSNHPFHVRMEEFSRRIWAPAQSGSQRETKWFYERARGQYADTMSKMTQAEKRRFKIEHPKPQMYTKTDLAKFENVWDEVPKWVNLGAQKNFAQYAARIGREWKKDPRQYNEFYFKRSIARGIFFRSTEKLVSAQSWYNGGYRANIVAYTLSVISEICRRRERVINFLQIWKNQSLSEVDIQAIEFISEFVNERLINPPEGISNVSEWAKRDACWEDNIKTQIDEVGNDLPDKFFESMLTINEEKELAVQAGKTQVIDDGIDAQKRIVDIPARKWIQIRDFGMKKKLFTPKEMGILRVACQIPAKLPSEKQCFVLLKVLDKVREEGLPI